MAIVSDQNVHDALAYLAEDPHPIALARKDVTDAENDVKEHYSRAFLDAGGSVAAKEAAANIDAYVTIARDEETKAIVEFERHRARVRAAEMLIEVWRSENANARAAEKVR